MKNKNMRSQMVPEYIAELVIIIIENGHNLKEACESLSVSEKAFKLFVSENEKYLNRYKIALFARHDMKMEERELKRQEEENARIKELEDRAAQDRIKKAESNRSKYR